MSWSEPKKPLYPVLAYVTKKGQAFFYGQFPRADRKLS